MRWPIPDPLRTIHFLGDLHVGITAFVGSSSIGARRKSILLRDATGPRVPKPLAHVQVGDLVEQTAGNINDPALDTEVIAWLNSLTAGTGAPWYAAVGNHDLWKNNRTVAQWETAYGTTRNRVVDFNSARTPFRLIIVGPDGMQPVGDSNPDVSRIALSAATLTWLGNQLSGTSLPCVIVCHAPLKNTFTTTVAGDADSNSAGMWITSEAVGADSSDILTVLAAHANAKAWVSGHTHPRPDHPTSTVAGMVTTVSAGGHNVAAVNCPAPGFMGAAGANYDAMWGTYLSVFDDRIEVRFRNHSLKAWDTPFDSTLASGTLPKIIQTVTL